ncbi:trypsin-like peptidase domain-containing protein [Streptomyces geranii]|uniref:trypsin-like peptidase domain-containing protein n=1 Tax=Streptomyces geranii TaxID=2058923 RepID=UPI000D03B97D|nr:trypsin-like peptidase domain-containing protein [Streptomyces geranii]
MAGRGPRAGGGRRPSADAPGTREDGTAAETAVEAADASLVRVCDLAGRPRGTGFVADHHGTLITSHEAVDGLARLVLHGPANRTCVVSAADAVTPLPTLGLALVRTEGLGVDPLPVSVRDRVATGTYVRIAAGGWREARVLGTTDVTYTATDRFHLLPDALELAIGTAGSDALRLGGGAAGGPVLDRTTGAVLGVLGTALLPRPTDTSPEPPGHRAPGFALSLRTGRDTDAPLADLLARNAATVPAYGADLNLAGVLELTATSVGSDGPPGALSGFVGRASGGLEGLEGLEAGTVEPVERTELARQLKEFTTVRDSPSAVLGLVGAPGTGRTTELAALAARRHRDPEPAPTLWLRGADLRDEDTSVADAARRALERAARIVAASGTYGADLGDITPERLAALAHRTDRPLLLLLDSPEEMPPLLAHRAKEWTRATERWLRGAQARLVVACRPEYWEQTGTTPPAGPAFEDERVERDKGGLGAQPPEGMGTGRGGGGEKNLRSPHPHLHVSDLTEAEAHQAQARYAIPPTTLTPQDARHPLTLRLLAEIRAALPSVSTLPDAPETPQLDRHDVFTAYLDLMCLRIAVRLAAENGLRGTPVRRLAAKVSGQVHEAARRSLGPGQGELDRASFESVFPWGPAPARLGGGTGWASAVLTEGLLVPAGTGYRFAHEELADWIQGTHLDLDEALHALVHRRRPDDDRNGALVPVPHHRIGPVVQSLLLLARQQGAPELAHRLRDLARAIAPQPQPSPSATVTATDGVTASASATWWATHLLTDVLRQVPDATPYTHVLRLLADRIVSRHRRDQPVPPELGPAFWTALRLPEATRVDLLRRLVVVDAPPARSDQPRSDQPRYLDAVAQLLAADPTAVQPLLAHWFDDDRPLPATPDATVATAAQALLHTHRHRALDDLTEALVDSAHRRADELLAVLAEEEPSALCRAVDRWAHDERPARRVAAVAYGTRVAPHARTEADRDLLRYAALTLLARPGDCTLHGGALALLVGDPRTRDRHLPQALRHFTAADPHLPPSALVPALTTHPEPVLDAFRARLLGPEPDDALRTLADVTTPALARRVAVLVREVMERRPETAGQLAAYVDRRLDHGPTVRPVLLPLVTGLLDEGPAPVRAALATVLAAPGTPVSRPLRHELLEALLSREHDPTVLDALLRATAEAAARHGAERTRGLVHRCGLMLVRTPEGATRFDCCLVEVSRRVPGFAVRAAGWLADTPGEWAVVVGPSTRRMIESLAGVRVPA